MKRIVSLLMAFEILTSSALSSAAPTIPGFYGNILPPAVNTLPVFKGNPGGGATVSQSGNQMTVNQNQGQANVIIDWSSFNIGSVSTVRFNQGSGTPGTATWTPNSSYAALNRIYDLNPSLIYGNLLADGKVYLINRNGILFGPGSQVNVYSLAASALNIATKDFNNNLLRFTTSTSDYDTGQAGALSPDVTVANFGTITTASGGFAALVGPQAVNGGTISSPSGKIALIGVADAGQNQTDVEFSPTAVVGGPYITYNPNAKPGIALNTETGSLISDTGQVAMSGSQVTQNGIIRAVSTVKVGGAIYLLATDNVTTGPKSLTSSPVSDSTDKLSQTYSYQGGTINIGGIYTTPNGTFAYTPSQAAPVKDIVNNGAISAPTGTINLSASDRVYLESGSSISVAGLWVDEPASANQIDAQLNSVQLADSYNQKGGALQGQNISATLQNGSSIGNINGSYTGADLSTQERSTTGGSITIGSYSPSTPLAEFIAKQGATLDFSGGGFKYAAGVTSTSKLLSGTTVYDISNAPANVTYQAVLGDQKETFTKFGVVEDFQGLYLGGGTPLYAYSPARTVGSNAGSLAIDARVSVLDSTLNGSVTRGQYQVQTTDPTIDKANPSDKFGTDYLISVARGLEEPVGGTLNIGNSINNAYNTDFGPSAIVVQAGSNPLAASFSSSDPLGRQQTLLSATLLINAGLSKLNLSANTSISIDQGARISLLAGGSYTDANGNKVYSSAFTASARQITDQGSITVPDGSVALTMRDNISEVSGATPNPLYVSQALLPGSILIGNNSSISVAGQTVDNSSAGTSQGNGMRFGHINGGAIIVQDLTYDGATTSSGNSIVVRQGALLDVSGGYSIAGNGAVTGGNAGSLTLSAATLSVGGDLHGFSLPDYQGGSITLHAGDVTVAAQGLIQPDNLPVTLILPQLQGSLIFGRNQLASSGFTNIELDAIHNVTFESGVTLTPSTVKSAEPVPANAQNSGAMSNNSTPPAVLTTDYVGPSSVKVSANMPLNSTQNASGVQASTDPNAQVTMPVGSGISVVPGGSITLTAPQIAMDGTLVALGGNISVTATQVGLDIGSFGQILAGGYNMPVTSTIAGVPTGLSPQAGGSVSLASTGSIVLETGSVVDVSGSPAAQVVVAGTGGVPQTVTMAGSAGSLSLAYGTTLSLGGKIEGNAKLAGVQGGTLTVNNTFGDLVVSGADIKRYQASGFDAMTFRSPTSLGFNGSMAISVGRSLTLDAPTINGSGSDTIKLSAPWVTLTDTPNSTSSPNPTPSSGNATLALSGGWLDVTGSSSLSGFSNVALTFDQDIRLSSLNYKTSNVTANWQGQLYTAANLTMQAARIYPTTSYTVGSTGNVITNPTTSFTVDSTGGVITVLPGATSNNNPIYSAGGSLTLRADKGGIDMEGGVLAAPLGTIDLESASGRVYLGANSVLTTGADSTIAYGTFDGTSWYVPAEASSTTQLVTSAPGKSITINAGQVIAQPGAKLDVSGGGTVYAYNFQADIEGTTNPISTVGQSALNGLVTRPNRYVIMPDNSVQLPGFTYTGANGKTQVAGAVYLNATVLDNGTVLKAGYYSLLPQQYAFLPGALIISDTGSRFAQGSSQRTSDGYQVVGGYSTFLGTGITSPVFEGYEIQSAANLLKQGNFTVTSYTAGNAGNLSISGSSTVLTGSINAASLPGYKQGTLDLNSSVINVQESLTALPAGFDFNTPFPAALTGQLQIAASKLSDYGIGTLNLGDAKTNQITVKSGSILDVPNITFSAAPGIDPKTGNVLPAIVTIEGGAQVTASSGDSTGGTITLSAPKGTVNILDGALIHASNAVALSANDVNLQGELSAAAHGSMSLASSEIVFVPDSFQKNSSSPAGLYLNEKIWGSFANYDQVTLTSSTGLNFQTDVNMTVGNTLTLDAGKFTNAGAASVVLNARNIDLQNSGSANAPGQTTTPGSSLTLNAGNTLQATGAVAFDGFATVNLASLNDMTLMGTGGLTTNGNLNMTAGRVTTSYYRDASNTYHAADFTISANGAVNIMNSGGTAGTTATPGGSLAITGGSITQSGIIEVAAGQVQMTAASGDITLDQGAQILAQGSRQATPEQQNTYDYTPGGQITLSAAGGNINLASKSVLDVSGANKTESGSLSGLLDAGAISLLAPKGAVNLAGSNLLGTGGTDAGINGVPGVSGKGGSFTLDTNTPSLDLNALNGILQTGGFTNQLNIRARQGDLTLAQGQTMTAQEIVLEADGTDGNGHTVAGAGNINIIGSITALPDSNGNGGRVELYAQNNLTVSGGIGATASQDPASSASGGYVYLNSEGSNGLLTIAPTAVIDVSGGPKSGTGGTVYLRAQQNTSGPSGAGVNMSMPGTINGAAQVVAEAFVVQPVASGYTINSTDMNAWLGNASTYIGAIESSSNPNMPAGWNSQNPLYHFRPGIEIQSPGAITLSSSLDLSPTSGLTDRFGLAGEPGVLTLRAAGNLNINASLVDHPTASYSTLFSSTMLNSWGFNLTAGADPVAASPLAVNTTKSGDLTIAVGNVVYTEDAPINFAAAGNVNISAGTNAGYMINNGSKGMLYSLASYGGTIRGTVGNDLVFNNGGAIQTATAGNLDLYNSSTLLTDAITLGAIRTTGEAQGTSSISNYWTYRNGGNISLDVSGNIAGYVNNSQGGTAIDNSWDNAYGGQALRGHPPSNGNLAANFTGANSTEGIATMGGGSIRVSTGGFFLSQIGAFGANNPGNMTIVAGGDLSGRFRVMNGAATLISGGNFGSQNKQQVIELGSAQFSLLAQGDVHLGAVLAPENCRTGIFVVSTLPQWNLITANINGSQAIGYMYSSLAIASLAGNLTLTGADPYLGYFDNKQMASRQLILPSSVSLAAAGDVAVQNNFYMAPSATGNLQLYAGGSINGSLVGTTLASIVMSDQAKTAFYGSQTPNYSNTTGDNPATNSLIHAGDTTPIEVVAGQDIQNLQLYLPKQADIRAGLDIHNLIYSGQNTTSSDLSTITAGRAIYYDMVGTFQSNGSTSYAYGSVSGVAITNYGAITQGGPGTLMVLAGNTIDLGITSGIQSIGKVNDSNLGTTDASNVIVAVGAKAALQPTAGGASSVLAFFNGVDGLTDHADPSQNGLREAGAEYSNLQAQGNTAAAQQRITQARNGIVATLFDAPPIDGSGSLSMTQSQISVTNGTGDIYVLTRGDLNVGASALSNSSNLGATGIYTSGGGAVNIFTGGSANVNESRVMTFLGGDITIWSDQGDINAGRGSRTSVSPGKQIPITETVIDPTTGQSNTIIIGYAYEPPAVGSGVRAVTSDPGNGLPVPNPGNIYLFAPQGVIDAGEAGIAGGKVILGATEVLNSQNISAAAGSVGVPSSSEGSIGIGALSGTSGLADSSKMIEQNSGAGAARDALKNTSQVLDDFMSKFLDVKVISFDEDDSTGKDKDKDKR
jgi:filamentous hemagglutinin